MTFDLTPKQKQAQKILASDATHIMLFGGSRSGKTALLTRNISARAIKAPGSRHVIFRFRFSAAKTSLMYETFPKVMQLAFPQVDYRLFKQDGMAVLPNESEIWFAGLDDKERVEKVLGKEYATIFLNECSQIPYESRNVALTRLAQKCEQVNGKDLLPRMYYDCNPPSKAHWTYKLFILKQDPDSRRQLGRPDDYVSFQINPVDNAENITDGYLETLNALPARLRKRFLAGEFTDATPGALFVDETIDTWRELNEPPEMVRVVIAVDPSGSGDVDNADNDEIGIVAAGLGIDGNAYILRDMTVKAGPKTWGSVVASAFDDLEADTVVGEVNFGGAMVNHVIQTARPRTPFREVRATRGKHVRAEPFSSLYESGKVRHVGYHREMEEELTAMTTNGYIGDRSPNRADAAIFALSELFPAIINGPRSDYVEPEHFPMDMPA